MAIVHFDSGAAGRNELKLHAPMRGRMMTQDARGGCCDFDREVQLFSNIVPIGRGFRQLMHYEEILQARGWWIRRTWLETQLDRLYCR
jgi:hypothetical protein